MLHSRISAALIATLVTVGCKDGPGPNGPLAGEWSGTSGGETYTMSLKHSGGSMTGTGLIYNAQNSATLVISGTGDASYFVLQMHPDQAYQPFTYTGNLANANELTGVFNGSGFSNFGVVFVRQR
jgi:hypothetical protein